MLSVKISYSNLPLWNFYIISKIKLSVFSFMCMFCISVFVLLYFFFRPLCCLLFFDLRIPITPLIPSNSSYKCYVIYCTVSNRVFHADILIDVHIYFRTLSSKCIAVITPVKYHRRYFSSISQIYMM